MKIYIGCPANHASGGPEALHQLCNALANLGYDAWMYYIGYHASEYTTPVHEWYAKYDTRYVVDSEANRKFEGIFVASETMIITMYNVQCTRKVIWWLSIDGYFELYNEFLKQNPLTEVVYKQVVYEQVQDHLVQSYYARQYLINKMNINENTIMPVSDYLGGNFGNVAYGKMGDERMDFVLFNPAKGVEYTRMLVEAAPLIKWVPLVNLTPEEVSTLMHIAKVYIDFGEHPGKDRIPREAALCGCCVITNKRGSAAYYEDVSIPDKYKFDNLSEQTGQAIALIKEILSDFNHYSSDFDEYRRIIREDKNVFCLEVDHAFRAIVLKELRMQCYDIGRNKDNYMSDGTFNSRIERIVNEANEIGHQEEMIAYLEKMISHSLEYKKLSDAELPILIYKSDSICYNVLNVFAEQFGKSLERCGQKVEFYDVEKNDISGLTIYANRRFKAIVGFQTYLMSIYMKESNQYLHDLMIGPKFNFVFDHPIWMKQHLNIALRDYYTLTLDGNYSTFIKKYYKGVQDSFLLPPAGIEIENNCTKDKVYDISFIGTYSDYREHLRAIAGSDREMKYIANRFLLVMKLNPNMTVEKAFEEVIRYYGMTDYSDSKFLEWMYSMKSVCYCMMSYYREKVMKTLLSAGMKVHVFGESWRKSALAVDSKLVENLIIHDIVTVEESLVIMQQSKISLNIMAWHKDGFTERIANGMLAQSVVLTDRSTYLEQNFVDHEDIVLYDLQKLNKLPGIVDNLLKNDELCAKISYNGYTKAKENHTWDRRAEEFLDIVSKVWK